MQIRVVQPSGGGGGGTPSCVRKKTWSATVMEPERDLVLPGPNVFTPHEKLVLDALAKKLSNKEIAEELNISERTVKFHLENIFSKVGVHDRHSVAKLVGSHHFAELLEASKA